MSHTMKAEEEANLERINERKSKSDVTHPFEPLIMSLIKGFVDNQDMSEKIKALYKVRNYSVLLKHAITLIIRDKNLMIPQVMLMMK